MRQGTLGSIVELILSTKSTMTEIKEDYQANGTRLVHSEKAKRSSRRISHHPIGPLLCH